VVSSGSICGNTINGNLAGGDGGGIYSDYHAPTIASNSIIGNTAANGGGGVYCNYSSPGITDNRIAENTAGYGGAIYCSFAFSGFSLKIAQNIIVENSAGDGGAIFCWESSPKLFRNTVVANSAVYSGGAICCSGSTSLPMVANCIFWGDSAGAQGAEIYTGEGSSIDVVYSDVAGGWPGVGNIDAHPEFVEEGWGNYNLLWGSPCIDTGHPGFLDYDGTRSDMGALFLDQSKSLVCHLTPDLRTVSCGDSIHVLYTLINCHGDPQSCAGIVELTMPNAQPWPGNPLEGPGYGIMHRYYNWRHVRGYEVPEMCPPGTWGFDWRVGTPGNLFDEASFELTVVEP
jgi:predicted outer membrane repeat protein